MARAILVIGKSGSGKSASLRNFDSKEYALINILGKELPFKNNKKFLKTFSYEVIHQSMLTYSNGGVKTLVIDDAGYLLTNDLMTAVPAKDIFAHFRSMATSFYNLVSYITNALPSDMNVYLFMHENVTESGEVKPKTVGKMLDDQVTFEGLFTTVLRAVKTSEGHKFQTQTEGNSVVKSPIGMFDTMFIDNDLKLVNDTLNNFYKVEKEVVINE